MVFNDILFKRIIVNNLKLSTFSIIYDAYSIVCVYTFIRACVLHSWDISTKYDFEIFRTWKILYDLCDDSNKFS